MKKTSLSIILFVLAQSGFGWCLQNTTSDLTVSGQTNFWLCGQITNVGPNSEQCLSQSQMPPWCTASTYKDVVVQSNNYEVDCTVPNLNMVNGFIIVSGSGGNYSCTGAGSSSPKKR